MKIEITNVERIHQGNLVSLGKKPRAGWKPTYEWAMDQLHAQHSTLEMADIFIEALVSGTTASHVVRASKGHPRFVVESHRPDWTGKARPPSSSERMLFIKANPYSLIEMFRQRLCILAADETNNFFRQIAVSMSLDEHPMLKALGQYAAPDCVYRGSVCHMHRKAWETCRVAPHWQDV